VTASRNLARWYSSAAVFVLNTIIIMCVFNISLSFIFRIADRFKNPIQEKYNREILLRAYADLDGSSIDELLRETWHRKQVFEPYVQFREAPVKSKFVNVHEAGFRISKNQGPWPPASGRYNVFLFGGSTTFSYGLPDDQTVASYLQESLATQISGGVSVYNFGVGAYQSTQERILFQELLSKGYRPNMAVFIDGLNDFAFRDVPNNTPRLRSLAQRNITILDIATDWPMNRLARAIRSRLHKNQSGIEERSEGLDDVDSKNPIDATVSRYLMNKRQIEAVAREFTVQPLFVWQPIPFYKYDKRYNPFFNDSGVNRYAKAGYERMRRILETEKKDRNFLWCADMQERLAEPLYVDAIHYNAAMSERLARYITRLLVDNGMLPSSAPMQTAVNAR
jgi:hypothetical protein